MVDDAPPDAKITSKGQISATSFRQVNLSLHLFHSGGAADPFARIN